MFALHASAMGTSPRASWAYATVYKGLKSLSSLKYLLFWAMDVGFGCEEILWRLL